MTVATVGAFAAIRHRDYRPFFFTTLTTMLGDNVEHVISYWMIFQAFHSPVLAGFAVISHWAPFLLFGVHFGALADRHDCRKLMAISQVGFIAASLSWSLLFLTGSLQVWEAVIILTLHGFSGAISSPASQILIHDIVGGDDLQSAVRLTATSRQIGVLFGPAVGGALLLILGPAHGLLVNALFYLPMAAWLLLVPYTGHLRTGVTAQTPLALTEALSTLRHVRHHRGIIVMVTLAGLSSLFVGTAYQAQMPQFATDLSSGQNEVAYSLLLAASAAGAVLGGLALEVSAFFRRPRERVAVLLSIGWAVAVVAFALVPVYAVAVVALFVAGALNLGFTAMGQTLVQLEAPPGERGRVVGLFSMSANGLRVGSGVTVGILGAVIGIHASLALSAIAFLAVGLVLLLLASGRARRARVEPTSAAD
ncbi:MAG: MFS transporter [Chloroflexota bacterium]|nr:MFS transporter [Chloroflexota bacterium]